MKIELERASLSTPSARSARQSWPSRERVLLRLSDGVTTGWGEAAPLPGYSRDSLEDAERALIRVQRAGITGPVTSETWQQVGDWITGDSPAARMALETAFIDYAARRAELPAPQLLGAAPLARIAVSCLVGAASDKDLKERARLALRAGYRHLKLKVGAPARLTAELDGAQRLRELVGASVGLRLDANGAWSRAQLAEAWPVLKALGIDFFEEPGEMPVDLRSEVPVALDESLQGVTPDALPELLARSGARAIVLKPTALGGLAHCLRLAEQARRYGAVALVSHCFEGSVGLRATAALALAIGGDRAQGVAPYEGASLPVRDGMLTSWPAPGLDMSGTAELR